MIGTPLSIFVALVALALPLSQMGCAGRSVLAHTNAYGGTTATALAPQSEIGAWKTAYESASDDKEARYNRNRIVRRLMLMDDERFLLWSQRLYGGKAMADTGTDIAVGVLTSAAAASNPAQMAATLSVIAAGLTGARVVVEKNIFLEKSIGALVSQMESDRAKVDAQITQYLKEKDTAEYPLEQGLRDFLRYYKAGTIAAASESLHSNARANAEVASAIVENTKGDTKIAPAALSRATVTEVTPHLVLNDELQTDLAEVKRRAEAANKRASEANDAQSAAAKVNATLDELGDAETSAPAGHKLGQPEYESIMKAGGWTEADRTKFPATPAGSRKFIRSKGDNTAAQSAMGSQIKSLNIHP